MKKLLFIFPIAIVMLVLQGCPDWDWWDEDVSLYFYLEKPKEFIKIYPEKDTYKVGDTINITYNIPSKLGAYATNLTKRDIETYLGVSAEEFDLYTAKIPDSDSILSHNDSIFFYNTFLHSLCKYNKEHKWCEYKNDSTKTISWVSINGREMKDESNKYYIYDKSTDNYTQKVQLVFSKPDTIYWDVKERDKNIWLVPNLSHYLRAQNPGEGVYYIHTNIFFFPEGYYAKDDIAFKVVE